MNDSKPLDLTKPMQTRGGRKARYLGKLEGDTAAGRAPRVLQAFCRSTDAPMFGYNALTLTFEDGTLTFEDGTLISNEVLR